MRRNFLCEIVARKRQVLEKLRANTSADVLRTRALEVRKTAARYRLRQTMEAESPALKIIAEFKRRSPSLGPIRTDLSPADIARRYERGGACAISVLTDEEHFGGSIDDLIAVRSSTHLPILRKDFIIDPIGLDALVEVHTSDELRQALNAGATLIGVNNRDLHTFEVSLSTSERLIAEAPRDKVMLSESGLQSAESLRRLHALGFRGFLIGEALMRARDPETALCDLIVNAGLSQVAPFGGRQR
ncbi:MAG: indole-3-glycerol-phosphate synthase [Verrucomicrobia bacterium]|nr:MAG: indole-3-glycerol-phosphate synthase [Verrucomicrobiota bacterium]